MASGTEHTACPAKGVVSEEIFGGTVEVSLRNGVVQGANINLSGTRALARWIEAVQATLSFFNGFLNAHLMLRVMKIPFPIGSLIRKKRNISTKDNDEGKSN
jgi:hypothetical protein